LHYYLDFCQKYKFNALNPESRLAFLAKLKEKKQPDNLIKQNSHALSLYYAMRDIGKENIGTNESGSHADLPESRKQRIPEGDSQVTVQTPEMQPDSISRDGGKQVLKQSGADWTWVFEELKNGIKLRHYAPKTLKSYTGWVKKFQACLRSKDPQLVEVGDVKEFLTWLAVEKHGPFL